MDFLVKFIISPFTEFQFLESEPYLNSGKTCCNSFYKVALMKTLECSEVLKMLVADTLCYFVLSVAYYVSRTAI